MTVPAIQVEQMTKFYGKRAGIMDFSTTVEQGSLVGLLGPNGAGKTTTIRILSCHMPPTSGKARVCGFDVFSQSLEVRKRLGYLPENCPLYGEMRVIEYMRWTAGMKGLTGSDADRSVFAAMDSCSINNVSTQPIRTLSKGYRQRVGLAAALVHRPEILILDEPTIGLDPLQVREFRSLIASLKGKHTVLISSHILSEIEMMCDSVIILNQGRLVASGSPRDLRGDVISTYMVECKAHSALITLLPQLVNRLPGVTLDKYEEQGEFSFIRLSGTGDDPRVEIGRFLAQSGIEVRELHRERVTLEDVFIRHIKTGLPIVENTPAETKAGSSPSESAPEEVS